MAPLDRLSFPRYNDGRDDGDEEDDDRRGRKVAIGRSSTGGINIFMNQKSIAEDDLFARLASRSGSTSPTGSNVGLGFGLGDAFGDELLNDGRNRLSSAATTGGTVSYGTPSLGSGMSTVTSSIPPSSPGSPGKARPRKRPRLDPGDRFLAGGEMEDRQRTFHLLDEDLSFSSSHRIIPHESDAAKEQANATFTTMLSKELNENDDSRSTSRSRPSSPMRSSSNAINSSAVGGTPMPTTPTRKRVFSFHTPPRTTASTPVFAGQDTPLAKAYARSPIKQDTADFITSPQRQLRSVCKTPFRVLDAPELTDDFYLNLVDWSSTNVLGVGLGSCVYLWSAKTAQVTKLCDLENDSITSLNWVQKGSLIAIGTFNGRIQIWDAVKCVRLRDYEGHHLRVGALAWNDSTITSGSRDRTIQNRDVRAPGKAYQTLTSHRQEVCGLKWNGSQQQLASGGNDNKLLIWDHRGGTPDSPLWKWHEHSAAVKAIAWNPHQPGVLASGGGTADKKMRFWNTMAGNLLAEVDTGSQVCNLIWSKTSQELVSTHGYSSTSGQNLICIWKYPSMDMVATLSGHTHRVLYLAMSPDGQTIVTGAGDETLRFWNAFPKKREEGEKRSKEWGWGGMIR